MLYDFSKLKGFLGIKVGVQTFFDGKIVFNKSKIVESTKLGWIDVTGEAS